MRWEKVTAAQTEEEWFDDYVKLALSTPAPQLPPEHQHIGSSGARWFLTEPGVAFIRTVGGSADDRLLAEIVVREQLKAFGIRQATYTFWHDKEFRKTAAWTDIETKAKRLLDSGQVQMLRNGAQNVLASVQGDHGTYQSEFSREDPNSQAMTQWQCECPWDQYAWQRTRQWKKYEGRPCAHVLATWWASRKLPLDDQNHPAAMAPGQKRGPQSVPGQESLFNSPQTVRPQVGPSPFSTPPMAPQGDQLPIPGMMPGTAVGTPPAPSMGVPPQPQPVLPQFQDPALLPQVNPASVPGLKQPTPTNPTQYPGGTFSSVTSATYVNGDMVGTKHEDWGTLIGRSEEHGSGQQIKIPINSVGEVLGTDPVTGMINVLFEDKMTENMGKLEPNGVVAWFFPSEIVARPDIRPPGPAIRRTR